MYIVQNHTPANSYSHIGDRQKDFNFGHIYCSSKIFRFQNLISSWALPPFLRIGRAGAIEGNVAFATTFEAGLQVSIGTVARHVTSLRKRGKYKHRKNCETALWAKKGLLKEMLSWNKGFIERKAVLKKMWNLV